MSKKQITANIAPSKPSVPPMNKKASGNAPKTTITVKPKIK